MESSANAPAGQTVTVCLNVHDALCGALIKHASNALKHLRRFLTADPGRFAGGSALSDPLGLLAVEGERLAALRSPQHDGSPQAAGTANQGTQPGASGDVTGPVGASGQPRSFGRTPTAVKNLNPGYFAFVMPTSIISAGLIIYRARNNPGGA
jgi:hypothetical protein